MNRGNAILNRLFSNSIHAIRQLAGSASEAKAMYRFLQNDYVSELDIISNMKANCVANKSVLCIDMTEIDLSAHENRLKKIRL
ncbi:hypothetical protein [Runella zeae]|uniref:hypothetical protein n=1 Tax=Runella zeae TaxID=94255 RepID=UPI00049168F1